MMAAKVLFNFARFRFSMGSLSVSPVVVKQHTPSDQNKEEASGEGQRVADAHGAPAARKSRKLFGSWATIL